MAGLRDTDTTTRVPDFDEGMRAAEEAAGIPPDAELYGEAFQAPEADEAGRVPASRGDDVIEETPAEEPVEEPAAAAEEPEAVEPPAENAELADLKRKVGQMANENAELRRRQEQQEAAQQYVPQPQMDMGWYEQALDEAPDQAAVYAAQQQQPLLYERAIRAWHDVDPVAAARYERSMEWGQLQNQMEERFAPQIKGAQDLSQQADLQAAMGAVQARHDDFDTVVGALDAETTQRIMESEFPTEILNGLTGNRAEKEKVLETLYRWAKSEQAPALVQGAVEAVSQGKEDARAAKLAATVASSTVTTPDPVEESEGERLSRVWKEGRPNMRDAWTGR